MTDTVLENTADASHGGGATGQGASPALPSVLGGLQPAEQPSTGSVLATTTANNWAKQRAAIVAEVAEQYAATAASQEDTQLETWLAGAARDLESADTDYQAKRQHFQQADYERTTARDARRADPKNAAKSTEWHASVQRAQQAQEALRAARELLARAQALCDVLQQEAAQRGLQVAVSPPARGTSTSAAGSKRKRKGGAPLEPCPYCNHTYTVRDGLSSKLDAKGNRLHLRRCQCREKTPPCRNCPKCKAVVELMVMGQSEEQQRACQATYACEICACKCPGAGKWVEADEVSRKAFAARTEQRFGALSALGWSGGAGAGAGAPSGAPSATTAAAGGGGSPAAATEAGAAGLPVLVSALPVTAAASGQGGATTTAGRAGAHAAAPSLRRLPADIRTELQAQHAQQGAVLQQEQSAQHHHRCQHPHDECTSECCSAAHVADPHANPHSGNGHFHGQLCSGVVAVHDLPTLAALAAVNAQHAQQGSSMPFLASLGPFGEGAFTSLPSSAVMLQQMVQQQQQLMQQLLANGAGVGGSPPLPGAAVAVPAVAAGQALAAPGGQAQAVAVPPPPELPSEVLGLLERVFLHAAGQQAVDAVKAYLQEQRVTCLSDLEYLELHWLVKALQPAGLPEMLLNKFLQLGRRQAAAGAQPPRQLAAVLRQPLQQQQQQQQQQQEQGQEPQEGALEV